MLFIFVFLFSLFSFLVLLIFVLDYEVDYLVSMGLLVVTTFVMYFLFIFGVSGILEGVFGSFFWDIFMVNYLVLVTISWRFIIIYFGMLVGLVIL